MSMQLEGGKELEKQLLRLDGKVRRKGIRQAARAGAKVVRQTARSLVPVVTGTLRKSLKTALRSRAAQGLALAVTGPDKKTQGEDGRRPIKYAHLVEYGTKRTKAQPFLRPAFDSTVARQVKAVAAYLRTFIEREARK